MQLKNGRSSFLITHWREITLLGSLLACITVIYSVYAPVAQSPQYHLFADSRTFLSVPNGLNVLSNLPLLLGPLICLMAIFITRHHNYHFPLLICFISFIVAVLLVSVGSAYYHLAPSSSRLLWDRLPMSMGFASLLCFLVSQRINQRVGVWLLPLVLFISIGSVLYWYLTEKSGHGDLRPYILVQAYPLLAILFIVVLYSPRQTHRTDRFLLIGTLLYGLAKLAELADWQIFFWTYHVLSGHTLKHLLAATAIYVALWWMWKNCQRKELSSLSL